MLTRLGLYKLLGENPELTWPFARRFAKPITDLLAPSWGYGHERMPETGGAVVAANHFSEVDPAVLGLHSRRTLYYMAKIELLSVPVIGEILRWTGAFAVRRGEGDRDSIRVARWLAREGHIVGMFMEGTRQRFGYPVSLDGLPANGRGYKEGAVIVEEAIHRLWRQAAEAAAEGLPAVLADGTRRSPTIWGWRQLPEGDARSWPADEWAAEPLGPV